MKKSTLLGALAGAVVLFLIGWIFYGMLNPMASHITPEGLATSRGESSSMPMLIVGHLIIGLLASIIYGKWARGVHNAGHGFQFGALLGAVIGLGLGCIFIATSNYMTTTGHLIEALYYIIGYGIMGAVISMVYAKFGDE